MQILLLEHEIAKMLANCLSGALIRFQMQNVCGARIVDHFIRAADDLRDVALRKCMVNKLNCPPNLW